MIHKQRLPPAAILCAATAAFFLMTGQSQAQAFTQEAGRGRVITSLLWSQSDKGFGDDGHVVEIADYKKTEVYLLAEYGVTDDLTVLLTPSYRNVSVNGGSSSSGLGYTDIGARYGHTLLHP